MSLPSRRAAVALLLAAPAIPTLPRGAGAACGTGTTPGSTEGPFYKIGAPERQSLIGRESGTRLVLSGRVLGPDCRPVPGALLDFWQADEAGRYDNQGFRLRGWQRADADGRYRLETVMPGAYAGRPRHLHVKVGRPDGPRMTTQLYFPDEPDNRRDGLFKPELLIRVADGHDGKDAAFDFVLNK